MPKVSRREAVSLLGGGLVGSSLFTGSGKAKSKQNNGNGRSNHEGSRISYNTDAVSPRTTAGKVYAGLGSSIYSWDLESGSKQWQFNIGDWAHDFPAVGQETVYAGGGSDITLYALDATSGEEQWSQDLGEAQEGGFFFPAPALSEDSLFIYNQNSGEVEALSRDDGGKKWGTETGVIISPVTVRDGVVFVTGNSPRVWALDSESGEKLWDADVSDYASTIDSSPTVVGDSVFVTGNKEIHVLNAETGETRWFTGLGGHLTGASVDSNSIYLGINSSDPRVVAIDKETGDENWSFNARAWGKPEIVGENILLRTENNIYALDKNTGKEQWRLPDAGESASFVVDGKYAFVISDESKITTIDVAKATKKWEFTADSGLPVKLIGGALVGTGAAGLGWKRYRQK